MTTRYRAQKDNAINPSIEGQNVLPLAETFDRAAFDLVLAQPGCVRLRVYYGMKEDLTLRAVIVGVNEANEDMLPSESWRLLLLKKVASARPFVRPLLR